MIKIGATTTGLREFDAALRGLSEGKIQTATAAALNAGARAGFEAGRAEMARVFDRPTRWVLGGIRYVKARRDKLSSSIDLDHWGNKQGVTVEQVLQAQVFGGTRRHKRHEVAMQRIGILPAGMHIVPGAGAEIDANGNMNPGQINQILAWFRAFGEVGYRANLTDKRRDKLRAGSKSQLGFEYFLVAENQYRTWSRGEGKTVGRKKMAPGIYKRVAFAQGSAIKPVMIFVRAPVYAKRFDFYRVVEAAAIAEYNRAQAQYLDQMLKERGL